MLLLGQKNENPYLSSAADGEDVARFSLAVNWTTHEQTPNEALLTIHSQDESQTLLLLTFSKGCKSVLEVRRADWCDLSFTLLRFGLPGSFVNEVRQAFPLSAFKGLNHSEQNWAQCQRHLSEQITAPRTRHRRLAHGR
jgi:hypothetical protein